MKILIMGSRPNPRILDADVVYFVNGSVKRAANFEILPKTYHIISSGAVTTKLKNLNVSCSEKLWIDELVSDLADETIFFSEENNKKAFDHLQSVGYASRKCTFLTNTEFFDYYSHGIGKKQPFGFSFIFYNGFSVFRFFLRNYMIALALLIQKKNLKYFNSLSYYFTPSSGIFALIHAIRTFGPHNTFYLSGISTEFWSYTYDSGDQLEEKLRLHVVGDVFVLKMLNDLNIFTDDLSVSKATGLKYF